MAQSPDPGDSKVALVPAIPAPGSLLLSANAAELSGKNQAGAFSTVLPLSTLAAERQVSPDQDTPFSLFETYTIYDQGVEAKAVGVGDFNHDGLNDVVMTSGWPENQLYIYEQSITASLSPPITYTTGSQPNTLAVGDLNNDGWDDVAVANFNDDTIGIYLQQANGILAGPQTYPTLDGPNAIAVDDLNGDSRQDVVISHWLQGFIGVFLQKPDGTLQKMDSYLAPQAGWDDLDTGDLNGDSRPDALKLNGTFPANPNLSVYLQQANGKLGEAVPYDLGEVIANGIAVGDITGDGLADAVMTMGGNRPTASVTVWEQTNTGTLEITTTYPAFDVPEAVELADVNVDGRADVLVAHGGWGHISVYLQDIRGSLAPYLLYKLPTPGARHYGPQAMDVGDINADGLPDVVIADDTRGLVVLYHRPPLELAFYPFSVQPYGETPTPVYDDFSDPDSGWPTIHITQADFEYLDGEYRIFSRQNLLGALASAGHRLIDLDVAVTARRASTAAGAYGVAFGISDDLPLPIYYALIVWPDSQEWNLLQFYGLFEVLFWGVSNAIAPGTAPNRLQVIRKGDLISLHVNGTSVFNGNLVTYRGARGIGLFQSPQTAGHDVRFDDYELHTP